MYSFNLRASPGLLNQTLLLTYLNTHIKEGFGLLPKENYQDCDINIFNLYFFTAGFNLLKFKTFFFCLEKGRKYQDNA